MKVEKINTELNKEVYDCIYKFFNNEDNVKCENSRYLKLLTIFHLCKLCPLNYKKEVNK